MRLADLPPHLRDRVLAGDRGALAAGKPSKPRKYRNRFAVDERMGVVYESELERDTAHQLAEYKRLGRIADWSWGTRFLLSYDPERPGTLITYEPDFIAWPSGDLWLPAQLGVVVGDWFVIDAKGVRTPVFNTKVRQWKVRYPSHPLVLVTKREGWRAA
jgi:hypothetical protein